MKKIEVLTISTLILLLSLQSQILLAQSGTVSTGHVATGTGGTVEYTVGQVVYVTAIGSNGSVSAGIQQPFVIQAITAIDNKDINLIYTLYPNPTSDHIILNIENQIVDPDGSYYTIYDVKGEVVKNGQIIGRETHIQMKELKSATYLIKTYLNKEDAKIFRVIKN